MSTWIESEREFARWLEQRFPGDGTVDERVARADRETFRRALPGGLVVFVVPFVLHGHTDRLLHGPGPVPRWQVVVWVLVAVVVVVAIVADLRIRPRRPAEGRSRVLDGLSRAQRRELGAELRFQRPVVPGDEPALHRLAVNAVRTRVAAWPTLGVAVALLPAQLVDPWSAFGVVRGVIIVGYVAIAVQVIRPARTAARYLAHARPAPLTARESA